MNHKVLLADDSLTIQKVIKITLANQPYDITDSSTEDDLFKQLPVIKPRIVFLDFNLSEKLTGLELTAKIKSICPSTKVLLLLGTFDTVEEAAMEKAGASDKIVKPFDSNKFIAICRHLTKNASSEDWPQDNPASILPNDEDLEMPDMIDPVLDEDPDNQWQMSSNLKTFEGPAPASTHVPAIKIDALSKEIADWGMSVPNVINDAISIDIKFDLPPVIQNTKEVKAQSAPAATLAVAPENKEAKFPENNDLDYPTIEDMQKDGSTLAKAATAQKPRPQLISIESLNNDRPLELEIQGNYVEDKTDIESIQAQIRDEVEEDLWHADEFEELKREVSSKIEEMKNVDEVLFRPMQEEADDLNWIEQNHDEPTSPASTAPDMTAIRSEIESMVKKYVQEYMDHLFQKNVEKITWEVVPDLAENLIRQELGKISHKILNDQN
jgi:CheY-like chemotaxis protein